MVIDAQNIHKSFFVGKTPQKVVDNISLSVMEGEFVSIMGNSGSGKSTLLYLLSGIEKPDSGSVVLCGKNLAALSDGQMSSLRRTEIGFVFQNYNLIDSLNVEENIIAPLLLAKRSTEGLDSVLESVGLGGYNKRRVTELSGGEKQRVAIARAVVVRPRIIFADEPTGNLDSSRANEIMQLFDFVNKTYKIAIVQVTHSRECAEFGQRLIRISDGKICSSVI